MSLTMKSTCISGYVGTGNVERRHEDSWRKRTNPPTKQMRPRLMKVTTTARSTLRDQLSRRCSSKKSKIFDMFIGAILV